MNKPMRKSSILVLLMGIFLISGCVPSKPAELPSTTTSSSIPLGISLYTSDNVDMFNQYARETDFISARPESVDLLDDVKVGKKVLAFTHYSDPHEMVSLAKEKGIEMIGYNVEGDFTKEELVAKEREVYELAKANGLEFVFGPMVIALENYYEDLAQYADVLVLQSQRYQVQDDYEEVVEGLIERIKSANPNVKVRVVVTVAPPNLTNPRQIEKVYLSADDVINNIRLIEDKADSVFIFYFPPQDPLNVAEEVFKKLREPT